MVLSSSAQRVLPTPIEGFDHINRYWDRTMNLPAAKILPGELYVSVAGEMIVTVLGSCIAVCIRDKRKGIGGMNHFMLPEETENSSDAWRDSMQGVSTRYGNWAMECLINEILKSGGEKKHLEVKVFGGGKVLNNMTNIGAKNIEFVHRFLSSENLSITAEDTGDIYPRKVLYFPDTGAVKIRKLKKTHNATIERREKEYIDQLSSEKGQGSGSVELF